MKKTILFFLMIALFSWCNCLVEDPEQEDTLFTGAWELVSLSGGFAPSETFGEGEIVWEFDQNDSLTISIDGMISDRSRLPIKHDTILFYSYDNDNVFIGSYEYEYRLSDTSLRLFDDLDSDGFMLELERKDG